KISVGATANVLMAAVLAEGVTHIKNAAIEPEITSLINFLNIMGAKINGKNTAHLIVEGVKKLNSVAMNMIPDRIEAGTFLLAGAITKSRITVANCCPEHLQALNEKLIEAGCDLNITETAIEIIPPQKIRPVNISAIPHPGFPTDLQAQFMSFMTLSEGECEIEDTVFPDRFMHVSELNRLDADIETYANKAIVKGVESLSGAEVMATDLRASAALVLAGLAAQGETTISRIYHIDRGYEHIERKLTGIGADIKRVQS
ncbi:MAG: UDP-N-acetylglucosamine 1-carboxyvinyltransferase, partial [Candidatus Cloacimonetes bacterium]|nr:UDP-N-acetylglucosamine 1-carboxyvinyltransferase [Candidatus Cloacimonadota bacterium]